jgi:DNA-binding MarR family transcriptional regulator
MTSVKGYPEDELHATLLMGLLFREVRKVFAAEDWSGLRQSHFRVISSVPPEGISVTDLGERLGMSKQGCGQFVTSLVESGHLRVEQGASDRRVRWVRRTPKGNRTLTRVTARMLEVENEWAQRVGERRYRTFRKVLEELADQ